MSKKDRILQVLESIVEFLGVALTCITFFRRRKK